MPPAFYFYVLVLFHEAMLLHAKCVGQRVRDGTDSCVNVIALCVRFESSIVGVALFSLATYFTLFACLYSDHIYILHIDFTKPP